MEALVSDCYFCWEKGSAALSSRQHEAAVRQVSGRRGWSWFKSHPRHLLAGRPGASGVTSLSLHPLICGWGAGNPVGLYPGESGLAHAIRLLLNERKAVTRPFPLLRTQMAPSRNLRVGACWGSLRWGWGGCQLADVKAAKGRR